MKFIKLYESFEDIDYICEKYDIENYTINEDGTIDIDGNVDLSYRKLTKLPLKFGNVGGHFSCGPNRLITLKGCPKSVAGIFDCSDNKLTSLEGCPQSVGGNFDCGNNQLTTLEFCSQSVGGHFDCSSNKLTTLEGCPQSIGSHFAFAYNQLKDLYGFPEFFDGGIYYDFNPVQEILNLFKHDRLGKVIDLLNEYGVIQQNGKVVILDRLEEVFYTLNLYIPKEINFKNYEVY